MDVADGWARWAPVSGLVFAASFLTLFFVFFVPGEPGVPPGANAAQIAGYYRGRGPGSFLLTYFSIVLAGTALLWFTGSLRAWLRRMEPAPGRLSGSAFGGGLSSAILFLAGCATLLGPFVAGVDPAANTQAIDPTLHAIIGAIGFTAINFCLFGAAVMIAATSLVALRYGGFPRWFGWTGFPVALALALNLFYFFGLFVWVGWILLASGLLLTRPVEMASLGARGAMGAPQPEELC